MNLGFRSGCLIYLNIKHASWRHFRPHVQASVDPHKLSYGALSDSFRRIALSQTFLRLNSSVRKPLTSSEQAPAVRDRDVEATLQGVLRRAGPFPLSRISLYLDDDSMEFLSTYPGGPVGFCSRYSKLFHVLVLPKRIHVLLILEEYASIPSVDRRICMWVASALVTALYMPKAIPLPATPSTGQLLQYIQENRKESFLHGVYQISQAELKAKLRRYPHVFTYHGDRLCLSRHRFILLGNTTDAIAQVMGLAKRGAPTTIPSSTTVSTHSLTPPSPRAQDGEDATGLIAFLKLHVPTTFFVPLAYVLQCPGAEPIFGAGCSPETVRAFITDEAANELFCIQMLASTLEGTYVRRLKPEDADCLNGKEIPPDVERAVLGGAVTSRAVPQKHQPPEIAAQAYNIFYLGERITQELISFQTQNELNYMRLAKGVNMAELQSKILSKELVKEIEGFFGASDLPNIGSFYLLIFDRLRHLYDVDVQQGFIRPWALLQSQEQPSSLTTTTTPLPLVLHSLQLQLSRGPLAISALYEHLSILCKRQLLSLYHRYSWMQTPRTEVDTSDAIARGCDSLRVFVKKHSLYFVQRADDSLCTPAYLASEAAKSVSLSRRTFDSDYPVQRIRKKLSDFEMVEMVYNILPAHEPVVWVCFSLTQKVKRSLPFDGFKIRQDFFKRYSSYFLTCEAFFTNRLILGRADCDAPSPDTLQPPLNSIEAIVKYIALHAVGGTTESEIMTSMSKEGRTFMKTFGTCEDLARKLPEWFEVRRGISQPGSSIITYIGAKSASIEEEDSYFAEFLPLRKKLNHASLAPVPSDST